jgi:hypothetical protein
MFFFCLALRFPLRILRRNMKTQGKRPATTVTLDEASKERIIALTGFVGGNVASFCAYWAKELSHLSPEQLRSVKAYIDSIARPQGAQAPAGAGVAPPAVQHGGSPA